jgi:hypothetical protein
MAEPLSTEQQFRELHDKNVARLVSLAQQGFPADIGGYEQHALSFIIRETLGQDAVFQCMLEWEQKVSTQLELIESKARQATLLRPGGPMPV